MNFINMRSLRRAAPLLLIMVGILLAGIASIADASTYTWSDITPPGAGNQNWLGAASDATGTQLVIGVANNSSGGLLYYTSNSGSTWSTTTQPVNNNSRWWRSICSSADGTKLLAVVNGGRLYTSTNSGGSWTERQPLGANNESWTKTACSSDGSQLVATVYNGLVYRSADYGNTWASINPTGTTTEPWDMAASNPSGSVLVAGVFGGRMYVSQNSGTSWSEVQPGGNSNYEWFYAATGQDGSHIIAAAYSGRLYTSTNYGASWTERQPEGNANIGWETVSSSLDGMKLLAGDSQHLYSSQNGGSTWTQEQPAGASTFTWSSLTESNSGKSVMAAAQNGHVYLGVASSSPTLVSTYPTNGGNSVSIFPNGSTFSMTFNEPVSTSTGTFQIHKSSDGSLLESISTSDARIAASTTDATSLVITPNANQSTNLFATGTQYYVTIDSGAVVDSSFGNAFAGISASSTWNFTTAANNFTVVTNSYSNLSTSSAATSSVTFNGTLPTVPSNNGTVILTGFEYSTDPSMNTGVQTVYAYNLSGVTPGAYSQTATGLVCGTTYYFQAYAASNTLYTARATSTLSFTTPQCPSTGGCGTMYQTEGNIVYAYTCGIKSVYQVLATPTVSSPSSVSAPSAVSTPIFSGGGSSASSGSIVSPMTSSTGATNGTSASTASSTLSAVTLNFTKPIVLSNVVGSGIPTIVLMSGTSTNAALIVTPHVYTTAGVIPGMATTLAFSKNLKLGTVDPDVKRLQQYLNSHGFVVSATGTGSPSNETTLFGSLTLSAVKRLQASAGIATTGFFGPLTRAYVNSH